MALLSTLTAGNLTAIRAAGYHVIQFLCIVPNDVVVQFQPSVAPSTDVYAQITVGTVASGSMSNIESAQTVIYSTTTDYQQTEVFRTRVRKVDGTSILYVAENSQSLTTAHYVTVLNTYEPQERLQRDLAQRDWDITYRRLLPIETALPSAYVLTNGDTSLQPLASAVVMDNDASSISTHAWTSSNSNDSFDDAAIAQPTITLEASAFRWLRYTFTDDLGNSNFRVIPCWTVPKDYSAQVATGFGDANGGFADISFDAELGWSCTITAFDGVEDVIDRAYCVVACDEWYNGTRQSIRTNINFVGFLQRESTQTQGDPQVGKLSETQFTIEGFGSQMARQNISNVRIIRTATPTAWGDIENPTPARMLTYHLSEGSTLLNLCSLTIPSDDTDFVGDDLSLTNGKVLDDVRFIGEVINAELQFDVDGKLDLARNLIYLDDTARNAADTVVEITPSDVTRYSYDIDYGAQTSQIEMSGGAFDSTNGVYDLYKSISPAVARLSEGDQLKISNQVLTTDSTQAQAIAELGERAANYFAANQPTYLLNIDFKPAWHFLVPDIGTWFTFPMIEGDTSRGKVFSASDRWQLISMGSSTNNNTMDRTVTAQFRLETQDTGAMVRTTVIENDSAADILYLPPVLAPFSGGDLSLTDGAWWDSNDPAPPSDATPPSADCEIVGIRNTSGGNSASTGNPALNGEKIQTVVRGSGIISDGGTVDEDFTASNGGFVADIDMSSQTAGNQFMGVHTGGVGWEDTLDQNYTNPNRSARAIGIRLALADEVVDPTVTVDYDITFGTNFNGACYGARIVYLNNGSVVRDTGTGLAAGSGTLEDSATGTVDEIRLLTVCGMVSGNGLDPGGSALFTAFTLNADTVYGDAFYYWTNADATGVTFAPGDGLQVELGDVSSIPPYSENHEYTFFETVTSGPVAYSYDTPYAYSEGEPFSLQLDVCFLGVP